MSLPVIILVLAIGLVLVALEIVALPGGVSGIVGGIFVAVGAWQTFENYGMLAGTICLCSSLVLGVLLLIILMKSKTWRKAQLNDEISSRANSVSISVGSEGVTLSRLAPAGKALISNEIVEVHTVSEFLDPETPIRVIEIDGYKITVERIQHCASESQ